MDVDQQVKRGQEWLEEVLRLAGFPSVVTAKLEVASEDDSHWLTIDESVLTAEQIETLMGANGAVLDSIQYLANAILNLTQESGQQAAFTVDLAGYRARRYSELKAMAEQAATQVRQTGGEYELKALSSAERRQVHTILKEHEDLETSSRGQEPDRRLIVRLLQP